MRAALCCGRSKQHIRRIVVCRRIGFMAGKAVANNDHKESGDLRHEGNSSRRRSAALVWPQRAPHCLPRRISAARGERCARRR
jgi:hypothetical protein